MPVNGVLEFSQHENLKTLPAQDKIMIAITLGYDKEKVNRLRAVFFEGVFVSDIVSTQTRLVFKVSLCF